MLPVCQAAGYLTSRFPLSAVTVRIDSAQTLSYIWGVVPVSRTAACASRFVRPNGKASSMFNLASRDDRDRTICSQPLLLRIWRGAPTSGHSGWARRPSTTPGRARRVRSWLYPRHCARARSSSGLPECLRGLILHAARPSARSVVLRAFRWAGWGSGAAPQPAANHEDLPSGVTRSFMETRIQKWCCKRRSVPH